MHELEDGASRLVAKFRSSVEISRSIHGQAGFRIPSVLAARESVNDLKRLRLRCWGCDDCHHKRNRQGRGDGGDKRTSFEVWKRTGSHKGLLLSLTAGKANSSNQEKTEAHRS
jgi:hypothetical protein